MSELLRSLSALTLSAASILGTALHAAPAWAQDTARPSAQEAQVRASFPDHELRVGDLVRIRVWPDTTLGGEFSIEDTGNIQLPILGEVSVAGLTLGELRANLRARYLDATRTPIVSVTVRFPVSVLGAVRAPGLYVATPPQTLFDAVSMAGGFMEDADLGEIRLFRADSVVQIDGQRLLEEGAGHLALALHSGDRIMVPRRSSLEVRDFLLVFQTLVALATFIQVVK